MLLLYILTVAPTSAPPTEKQVSATTSSETARGEIMALEARIDTLERSLRALKSAGKSRPRRGPPERGRPVVKAKEADVQADAPTPTSAALVEAITAESSPVRREVTQIVRDEFSNMRGEWRAFRQARHESRDSERVEKFASTADLDEEQANQLSDLLSQEREDLGQNFRSARDTFDFRGARDKAKTLREETDRAAAEFLDEKQMELWKEDRSRRRGRPRW